MAYMLDPINNKTARARRNKPPMIWPICWNIFIMKQLKQATYDMAYLLECINHETAEKSHLRHAYTLDY